MWNINFFQMFTSDTQKGTSILADLLLLFWRKASEQENRWNSELLQQKLVAKEVPR